MRKIKLLTVSLTISLLFTNISATNYYVTSAGINTNDGLTWVSPITLDAALALAVDNDVISIGAGTYTPTVPITNGNAATGDVTFEIKKNISIIGGYPTIPTFGAVPASTNITLLDGLLKANHIIAITAPVVSGKKVTLSNLSVTGGKSGFYGASTITINTLGNTGTGNGCGIWNDASTVTLNNTTISGNQTTGTCAGIYAVNSTLVSKTYMYNSSIINNTAPNRTAYYGRENSEGIMVNCTVSGNTATLNSGAGIILYTNNVSTKAVKFDIINSTITNNSNVGNELSGGIRVNDQYCTLNIYNSIVSGNTSGVEGSKIVGDIALFNSGTYTKTNTVITDKIYDATGAEVVGKNFDFTTMLGALSNNGGDTKTCKLLLTDETNPARTLGMSAPELTTLGGTFSPVVPESTITYDQLGNLRNGRVIGAWTANGITTSVVPTNESRKLVVFAEGNGICVETRVNDVISVYTVSGQLLFFTKAASELTRINELTKGSIYILRVNSQATKITL